LEITWGIKLAQITDIKDAIKTAIQMEKDGYSFYKKAAAQTKSEAGRDIFESLAQDEEVHLDVFQKMFQERIGREEWDDLVNSSKKYQDIPIFPKDLKSVEGANPDVNDLDAIRMAMDSEKEAIDYYTEIWTLVTEEEVKKIINKIIDQERNHYFLLQQEFDHLDSAGSWYELNILGG
jgi:rubrerythrin